MVAAVLGHLNSKRIVKKLRKRIVNSFNVFFSMAKYTSCHQPLCSLQFSGIQMLRASRLPIKIPSSLNLVYKDTYHSKHTSKLNPVLYKLQTLKSNPNLNTHRRKQEGSRNMLCGTHYCILFQQATYWLPKTIREPHVQCSS